MFACIAKSTAKTDMSHFCQWLDWDEEHGNYIIDGESRHFWQAQWRLGYCISFSVLFFSSCLFFLLFPALFFSLS